MTSERPMIDPVSNMSDAPDTALLTTRRLPFHPLFQARVAQLCGGSGRASFMLVLELVLDQNDPEWAEVRWGFMGHDGWVRGSVRVNTRLVAESGDPFHIAAEAVDRAAIDAQGAMLARMEEQATDG